MEITDLLVVSQKHKASDLHISADSVPMLRIDGKLKNLDIPALSHKQVHDMLFDIMNDKQRAIYEEHLELDFSIQIAGLARFRVNAFHQTHGASGVFRVIPTEVLSLEELKAPQLFKTIAELPRGLVLVTGQTGTGKTTTLAAMLNHINETMPHHILTIEDPIEFIHKSKKCLISQREVFKDTTSFSEALRSALRADPDAILVGELRDLETIKLALTAAETGHTVFASLHTSSAAKTIDRVIDVFPGNEKDMVRSMLSESLRAVISQLLIPKISGSGRVASHEIMLATPAVRNLIRENKISQLLSVMQTNQALGMQTMDQSLQQLVKSKQISKEEAYIKAENKELFH